LDARQHTCGKLHVFESGWHVASPVELMFAIQTFIET
jgi:hypothetical protein